MSGEFEKVIKANGKADLELISKSKRSNKVLYIEDDIIADLQCIPPFDITVSEKMRQIVGHFVREHKLKGC